MSTSSTHQRVVAAAAAAAAANAEAREARISAAEAAVQQAAEMARAAVATAEAAAATVAALREDADDQHGSRPRDPHRHCNVSPSPVQRDDCHHRRGSPPVVQRVIKESGGSTPWLMLTNTNYNNWSLLMNVKLQV
jgi:hypothetical protein